MAQRQATDRAREEAHRGRRARARIEREAAARRRRLALWLGGATAVVVVAIVAAAFMLTNNGGNGSSNAALTVSDQSTQWQSVSNKPLTAGAKAPDFNLATLGGKRYTLSGQRGHPVLLELFAVWCPHCQAESAILNQLDANLGPKGLRTLAILANPYGKNFDSSGQTDLTLVTKQDVTWFEQTFKVAHPTLIDPRFATIGRYGLTGYPQIFIIDRNGVIRYVTSGERPYSELAADILKLMK